MILQIRTKDNLETLLKQGNSPAWVIADYRVPEIKSVEIYQFDGKRVLKADFDAANSTRTESDRLVVAFKNGVIEDADMDWNGQNPIKYQDSDLLHEITAEQKKWIEEKRAREYEEAPAEWLAERRFILHAVKEQPLALEFADIKLKADNEIIMTAVQNDGRALQFAVDSLKNDKAIVLMAVQNDGASLEFVPEILKGDKEVVMASVAKAGYALNYASPKMRKNKEIVLVAVSQYGNSLEYADCSLQSDKEVVKKAIAGNINAISYADKQLLENVDFIIELMPLIDVENQKALFFNLPFSMRADQKVLELISPHYPNAARWIKAEKNNPFLEYLAYFDSQKPWGNEDNLADFVDEYGIELKESHFESLKPDFAILIFEIENSNYAWEELGGEEKFTIIYYLNENKILPHKKQSPNEDDRGLIKKDQYLNSLHVGLYEPYHNDQKFEGCFTVSDFFDEKSKNHSSFSISFHGAEVEDHSCASETLEKLRTAISPQSMYQFITDVLRHFQ